MPTNQNPLLTFEEQGAITLGTVTGTNMLDGVSVPAFGNEAIAYIEGKAGLHLLLDFKQVEYMSSAALTELLRINEELRKTKGSVRLCNLSNEIRKVFQITNLEKLFVIHENDSTAAATKRFERSLAVASEEDTWSNPDTSG